MILLGLIVLTANTGCLLLIQKHRHGEIHMRASWIFSKNDVIANTGVGQLPTFTLAGSDHRFNDCGHCCARWHSHY